MPPGQPADVPSAAASGEIGKFVGRQDGERAGRDDLAAQLRQVALLGTQPDRHGDRDRQDAGILGAEEGDAEARPGIGHDHQPLAAADAGAEQTPGEAQRLDAQIGVGEASSEGRARRRN